MVTRYYNAKILQGNKIVEGEMVVYNNLIAHVGGPISVMKYDKEIDVKGNLIMPTFKNAHTHSPMTFLRSLADDLPLNDWLNNKVFPAEAKLKEEDCYWLQKLAILEYVQNGIGTISDMYFLLDSAAEASRECGIRNVMLYGASDNVCSISDAVKKYSNGFSKFTGGLIEYRVGLHAEYTCSLDMLKKVSEYCNANKHGIYVHMSETEAEVEACIARYKKTPVELFNDLGLFNNGGTVYHMVYPKNEDLDILKSKNVNIVSCPASNMKLSSGIAPIKAMLDKGLVVGLGTDGPASNNSLNMFKEMYLAAGLQKLLTKDAACLDAGKILEMATVDGAKAMGQKNFNGLDKDQHADFIIIDLHQANMQPENNILKNLVYAGDDRNVLKTVVDGKTLYEKGEFYIGEDVDKIYSMCTNISNRIKTDL